MSIATLMGSFLVLMILGVPIGFAMGVAAFSYFFFSGRELFFLVMPEKIYTGISVFVLMAVPFFMLAGEIMNRSGVTDRLVVFANIVIGRVRGGLAQVNVLASILFAGITGVALGDAVALGTVFVPAMEKQGYDKPFSVAVTAASAIIGPIIPPSVIMIVYAAIMQVSVGAMFVGGIIPGLLVGLADMLIVKLRADKRQYPKQVIDVSTKEFFAAFKDASLALLMPVIIVGGIVGGVFTPTEAAAVAVVYGTSLGLFVYKSLTRKDLLEALKRAVFGSAKLFFIVGAASMLTWIFSMENLPGVAEALFRSVTTNRFVLLLMINLFFLFMGTWLDVGVSIILFAPVLGPLAVGLGVDPIQFGIMIVVNSCIGLVTPPVGVVSFAVCEIAEIDILDVAKELLPFILINFVVILAVAYIPQLTLLLPHVFGFR